MILADPRRLSGVGATAVMRNAPVFTPMVKESFSPVPQVAAPETSGDWTGLVDSYLQARFSQTLVIWEKFDDIFLSKFRVFIVVLKETLKGDQTYSFRTEAGCAVYFRNLFSGKTGVSLY
jgi:hypothetical protein